MEATKDLYLSCKRTLEKACWNAWKKNPLIDLDDYRSYADEIFMDSTKSYNPESGTKFNSWLTTQLLRLKPYAARYLMATDTKGVAESLVLSMDSKAEVEGKDCTGWDLWNSENDRYSKKISVPDWACPWEQQMEKLKPFVTELGDDARQVVDDILSGDADKHDENGVPVAKRGKEKYSQLTPMQLYVRLYRKRGWSLQRVTLARTEVEHMLRKVAPVKSEESVEKIQGELF